MCRLAGGGGRKKKQKAEEASLRQMMDISENEIKDAVAYKKYLTEQHSSTSGTVVSLFCTVNLPYHSM